MTVGINFFYKTTNPKTSEVQSQNNSAIHTFTSEFDIGFTVIH